MRNLICVLLLLLFAGTHVVPVSGFASAGSAVEAAESASALTVPVMDGSGSILMARQKCCAEDDALKTTSSTAPCASDCSFTSVAFDPEFTFEGTAPSDEPASSLHAAFRHALFRPPIA